MTATFEILSGLPAYGPIALPFPVDGQHAHREGLVVQFNPNNKNAWVGNFQLGTSSLNKVINHPNNHLVIIVAGGNGYVIDPKHPSKVERIQGHIMYLEELPHLNAVLFGNGLAFEAWKADGTWWNSPRISWDGMRVLSIRDNVLHGEGYSPINDQWCPFNLDLLTGHVTGSIYESQMARAIPINKT